MLAKSMRPGQSPLQAPTQSGPHLGWGERLAGCIDQRCRMERAVRAIRSAVGKQIGARSTFDKLLRIDSVQQLDDRARFRAWLLLTTIGVDPADFELSEHDVPTGFEPRHLAAELQRIRDAPR